MSEIRLIDANKLIADVQDKESRAEQMGLPIMADAYCLALGIIETAPTVDAVVVVRCKYCIHRGSDDCPMHIRGRKPDEDFLKSVDDDFCPYGKRKE